MSIKIIMVPIGVPERDRQPVTVALSMAQRFDAHVIGLHVKADPRQMLPYSTIGLTENMAASVRSAAERSAEEVASHVRTMFAEECERAGVTMTDTPGDASGVSAGLLVESGRATAIIAERGRLADLIVARRPVTVHPSPPQLEAMLRETGRPVLLVPPGVTDVVAKRIAVGWNCSSEAASAVFASMPLLAASEAVSVLTTKKRATMRPSADDVVSYLSWHGVNATARIMSTQSKSVGEALAAETVSLAADLLVIGSYSRRRLREMVMGGVTSHVLERANLPVLMVH